MKFRSFWHMKKKVARRFLRSVGYKPNLEHPVSFNEKIQWLKLYYRDPLMTLCADKYLVRDYIEKTIGGKYLVPLISVFDRAEQINFDRLPDKFVLKVNHGWGQNIVVRDKGLFDYESERKKLEKWLHPKQNHYYKTYEWCYKNIKPRLVCEQYIDNSEPGGLREYKILCFNGKARLLFVCSDRDIGLKVTFFDLNWNRLPFTRKYPAATAELKKPGSLEKMIRLSERLAKPFPFVRVDFYEQQNQILFGELTFYPGGGMEPFSPVKWDYKLGEMLILPESKKTCKNLFLRDYAFPDRNIVQ